MGSAEAPLQLGYCFHELFMWHNPGYLQSLQK